jgi:hypothetical protein
LVRSYKSRFKSPLRRADLPHDSGYAGTSIAIDLSLSRKWMKAHEAFEQWREPVKETGLKFLHGADLGRKWWDRCMLASMFVCRREATKKPRPTQIWFVYKAVRLGAWCAWNNHRRKRGVENGGRN